jgi:hypothetical protein
MKTILRQNYKCDHCNADALKHLDCGLLIEAALTGGVRISAMPYVGDHLNLCGQHLNEANITYVHYNEYELGHCPSTYVEPAALLSHPSVAQLSGLMR